MTDDRAKTAEEQAKAADAKANKTEGKSAAEVHADQFKKKEADAKAAREKKTAETAYPEPAGIDPPGPGQGLHAPSLDEAWKKEHAEIVNKLESVKQELFDHRHTTPEENRKAAAAKASEDPKKAVAEDDKKSTKTRVDEDVDESKAASRAEKKKVGEVGAKSETFPNPYSSN